MTSLKRVLCFLLLLSFFSCKKPDVDTAPTPQPTSTGVVRPVGEPIGSKIEKSIGAQGGTLSSADGRFTIQVPAGALSSNVSIGIQPITRTLEDGSENTGRTAIRLTPHGQTFLKPVKITFNYTDADVAGSVPEALSIAYQDEAGKWKGKKQVQLNKTAKTVSVTTTHFSDWADFLAMNLQPQAATVPVNLSVTLRINSVGVLPTLDGTPEGEDAQYIDKYDETNYPYPIEWRIVTGPNAGKIVNVPTQPAAIYTAPPVVPTPNPVLIEAKVYTDKDKKKYVLLLGNINILQSGIHLRVNGGEWLHFNDTESFSRGESYVGSEGDFPYDKHAIYIRINGGNAKGVGTWAWNDQDNSETSTTFEYISKKPGPYTTYTHVTYPPDPGGIPSMSPGNIKITEYKKDQFGNTWATGEFLIGKSTPLIDNGTTLTHGPDVQIQGYFHLRVE